MMRVAATCDHRAGRCLSQASPGSPTSAFGAFSTTRVARVLVIGSLGLMLTACAEPIPINDKNPGVYKGAADPLMEQSAGDRATKLSERLSLIQNRQ